MLHGKRNRVLMIVENGPFVRDPRVRKEAMTLQSAGYKVSIICPAPSPKAPWHEHIDGIAVYMFRPTTAGLRIWEYFLEYAYATLAICILSVVVLMREGFDVIHVANPPDTLVLIAAPYKLIGKRIIYDQHDLCPELFEAKFARIKWLVPLLLALERWSYRLADHVIVTNESYGNQALTRGRISDSKITIVRNGPDLNAIRSASCDSELRNKSENIIAYTGTIGFQDGLDYLCRVLHYLRYQLARNDFCCVIIGDGDALSHVKALVQELHLVDNVCFTGWIDDCSRYLRYLNTADICVSPDPPTTYSNQSTFIKIMDYMSAGKPIVAFDLAETRYSAQDSCLYPVAEDEQQFALCLAELMNKPDMRRTLGAIGQKRIREQLAWQYSVPHLLNAYSTCLGERTAELRTAELELNREIGQQRQLAGERIAVVPAPADSSELAPNQRAS